MKHLLHSVDSLATANGGLPLAVCELTSALAKIEPDGTSLKLDLISSQSDLACLQPNQVNLIATENWHADLRASHQQKTISLIHQHGIWVRSSHTTASFARLNKIPLIISPHGMLEPWALKHHGLRKQLALFLYQKRDLKQAIALHATCEAEAEHIRDLGFTQAIAIISNGVSLPELPSPPPPPKKQANPAKLRTALFLSRLHPKKGAPILLEAWAKSPPPDWKLVIAGNDEGGHLRELKNQAQQLGISSLVTFPGPLYDEAKKQTFNQADLFILPSHSENFAIVIAEALAHGLPVITTTETPWQILEQKNCGWSVDVQADALAVALSAATQLTPAELQTMGQHGKDLIDEKFLWPKIAKQMLSFYHWLLDQGERPDFVI